MAQLGNLIVNGNGRVIGSLSTADITSSSTITCVTCTQTSDERDKNIHRDVSLYKSYELIEKCSTIMYALKNDSSNREQIGLIAQEVREFFPEIVYEDNNGHLSLDYARLSVALIRVLKDVIDRLDTLDGKTLDTVEDDSPVYEEQEQVEEEEFEVDPLLDEPDTM